MKFQNGLNPFTPFLSRPGEEMDSEEKSLVKNLDQRLKLHPLSEGTDNNFQPGARAAAAATQQRMHAQQMQLQQQQQRMQQQTKDEKKNDDGDGEDSVASSWDDDSDFSEFEDDLDDDGAMAAFRARRLAELKRAHREESEQMAKGHGELRTILQDEFLPECTGSLWVVVHFFHKDFERCKIMDHHLKILSPLHLSCKFVRIDAEKTPFFVEKLQIKTLPTLLVFKDGKMVHRLTGFDGLADFMDAGRSKRMRNLDEFSTAALGRYLEITGCLEYEGPEEDDDDGINDGGARGAIRKGTAQSRFQGYDEDV